MAAVGNPTLLGQSTSPVKHFVRRRVYLAKLVHTRTMKQRPVWLNQVVKKIWWDCRRMRPHFTRTFDVRAYSDKEASGWFHISKIMVVPALQGAHLRDPPRRLHLQGVYGCSPQLRYPRSIHLHCFRPRSRRPRSRSQRYVVYDRHPPSAKDIPSPVHSGIPPSPPPPRAMNCSRCMAASVNLCRSANCLNNMLSMRRKCGGVSGACHDLSELVGKHVQVM